jgi:hypothetical protein
MFEELLIRIAKALDNNYIPYMIVGGQAVLLYGEPRLTKDMEDAKSIMIKNPNFDKNYIRKWLKVFDNSMGENKFVNVFKDLIKE